MDALPIGELMRLFEVLSDGPTKEFIQTLAQRHHESENHDRETSLRMAMTHVFSLEWQRDDMLRDWGVWRKQPLTSVAALIAPCRGPIEPFFEICRVGYRCMQCRHDAGDRRDCLRDWGNSQGCGCTGFAIKRRQLRDHRRTMRIVAKVIDRNDLWGELDDELMDRLGNLGASVGLEYHHEMDEGSDAEDPMVTQANELSNVDNIVQMSRNMVELAEVRRGLKRTRGSD